MSSCSEGPPMSVPLRFGRARPLNEAREQTGRRRVLTEQTRLTTAAFLGVAVPLISYFAVLKIGVPAVLELSPLSVLFPIVAIIGVLLFVALSRTSRAAHSAAAALTIVLFALPLSARWHSGRSDGTQFGGLLPFSDANGYYHCARVLAEGGDLRQSAYPVFCSRRPLFTAALAGLLALTHQNLRWTLALLAG